MSKEKPLNKQEKFVCEMLFGGVPQDVKWVRDSGQFKSGMERFNTDKTWADLWKQETDKSYNPNNLLEWFSTYFNRHERQVTFLLRLLDWDYAKLYALEVQIKKKFVFSCPADLEEVDRVMNL